MFLERNNARSLAVGCLVIATLLLPAAGYSATPLDLACANGNAAMIRVLLDAGADPNALDPGGEPALWAAIRSGTLDAVKVLLDRGSVLDFKDSSQQNGLMLAVRENYPDI